MARVVHHIKPNLLALGITRPVSAVALLTSRPTEASDDRAPALAALLAAVEQALRELPAELPV